MIIPFIPKRDIQPYYPCVVDIETAKDGSVIAIGFGYENKYGEREYECFSDWESWFDFVLTLPIRDSKYRQFYAHNGLGFDWLSFLRWARENREDITDIRYIYNGGFGIGCTFKVGRYSFHLRDSMRLLPGSLKQVCKAFNTNYQKINLDGKLPEQILRENPDLFYKYLEYDCFSLQEALKSFWQIIYDHVGSIERLPLTLPSLAMKLFRMTLKEPIMTPRNEHQKELERRAYSGGRTECYYSGVANVRVYDVTSEYPFVMRDGVFPVSYIGGFTSNYDGEPGIYHVRFRQLNTSSLPVLRDETTHAFQYEGEGVYAQPEIENLLNVGGEIECIEGYVYEVMDSVFNSFIQQWWGLRQQALYDKNPGLAYVAKIMMNSLYGKFGQKETGTVLVQADADKQQEWLEKGKSFQDYGDYCLVEEELHSEYTFVGVAAYITALARTHLYKQMRQAQEKGGTIWACDTDSVHVENVELPLNPQELGGLKLEFSGNTAYVGKKCYSQEGGSLKAKGIGNPEKSGVTHATMIDLANGTIDSVRVSFPCAPTFREVLIQNKNACEFFERTRTLQRTSPMRE